LLLRIGCSPATSFNPAAITIHRAPLSYFEVLGHPPCSSLSPSLTTPFSRKAAAAPGNTTLPKPSRPVHRMILLPRTTFQSPRPRSPRDRPPPPHAVRLKETEAVDPPADALNYRQD